MAIQAECKAVDLVLVGAFGCHPYMNPDWVSDNLLSPNAGQQVKLNLKLDGRSLDPSFSATIDGFTIDVSKTRIVVRHDPFSVESFDRIERIVHTLSELLPHTACSAMGVNFTFSECRLPDGGQLVRPIDALYISEGVAPVSISASYPLSDVDTMNVTMKDMRKGDQTYTISFNFDTKIAAGVLPSLVIAKNKLIARPIADCYRRALSTLGIEDS